MRRMVVALGSAAVIAAGVGSAGAASGDGADSDIAVSLGGSQPTERLFAKGEVVVRFERATDAGERAAIKASVGAESATSLEVNRAQLLELPAGQGVRVAVAELSADPSVAFAEPNYSYNADSVPNDTFFGQLWGLNNTGQTISTPNAIGAASTFPGTAEADIDAPVGWDVPPVEGGDASGVIVAVADTGIDYNHPDLAPNMWHNPGEIAGNSLDDDADGFVDNVYGADFQATNARASIAPTHPCTNSAPPACTDGDPIDDSDSNHGTHVAGTVGARGSDGYGVTGVAQRTQLMAVKVFDAFDRSSNVSVSNAFDFAADNGAKVVNASLGGPCPSALQANIIRDNPGVLFVFSAGNGGDDGAGDNNDIIDDLNDEFTPAQCGSGTGTGDHPGQYPCNFNDGPEAATFVPPNSANFPDGYNFDNVICVAASTNTDARASYSNYGPTSVQIAAPGSQVLSTQPAYQSMHSEGAEEPGFDGRLTDGTTPITTATTINWQRVTSGFGGPRSGAAFLSDGPTGAGGNYGGAAYTIPVQNATDIDTTGVSGCHLEYYYDILTSSDSGDFIQSHIRAGATVTPIEAFTGSAVSYVWRHVPVPEANGIPNAGFRFTFSQDGDATVGEGAALDDVDLRCLGGSYTPNVVAIDLHGTHKFFNGTSMATPQVAGAAALIRAKAPALTPAQVIQRIMDGGDAKPAFANPGATPVQSGKRLNLPGALNAGSQPVPAAPTIGGPSGTTNQATPTFTLTTDLAGSRFQCGLDGTAFGDCTTADTFTPASALADGAHELKVRAIGGAGGVSPTTTHAFTVDPSFQPPNPTVPANVDTTKPTVTITKGPKAKTKKKKATFEFTANEAVSFTCRLDKKPAAPCTSPQKVKAKKGKHTFTVTATDGAGNVGTASQSWKVKKKPKKN